MKALHAGDTFYKSGVPCTVLNVSYDGVVTYQWEDSGGPDGPYFLHLHPENEDERDDWQDVEIIGHHLST